MILRDKLEGIKITPENREKLFFNCVEKRLTLSKQNYEDAVQKNCIYILSRSNLKVIKALDRYQKRKEKNNNEEENKFGFIESL